jgi:hypothetical protein
VIIEMYVVLTCPIMQSSQNRMALCLDFLDISSNGDEFAKPIEAPAATVPAPNERSDM